MKHFAFDISSELEFRTSKSGGKGGQHVNKTETKVEVIFDLTQSMLLDEHTRNILLQKLGSKLIDGKLTLYSQDSRSQLKNKEDAVKKLYALLDKALEPVVKRKKTKVSKAVKEKRLKSKKLKSEIKSNRRRPEY